MRHFSQLTPGVRRELFHREPAEFGRDSRPQVLAHALGATLYVPGDRPDLAAVIRRRQTGGVRSMVVDLEDAVHDRDLAGAVDNTVAALVDLADDDPGLQLFVRTRHPEQIPELTDGLGDRTWVLSGFVAPKFSVANAPGYLRALEQAQQFASAPLYLMPVLETPELLFIETRDGELDGLLGILDGVRDRILCLRLGATDLCGLYGIRRDRDLTIYQVQIVADLIAAIVNRFGRLEGTGYAISGPVWEYFAGHDRLLKPRLRMSPFESLRAGKVRDRLIQADLDGLIQEIVLDQSNGLLGKTVIHPSHVSVVHAMMTVSHEEYTDACDILAQVDSEAAGGSAGGVGASGYRNKMNEFRPHRRWAEQIMVRASVFGVLNADVSVARVLAATEISA